MADIPNYPSNSAKTKKPEQGSTEKERPPIEAVVESGVIKRKKSFGRKLGEVFVVEDTLGVVGYVVLDQSIRMMKAAESDNSSAPESDTK